MIDPNRLSPGDGDATSQVLSDVFLNLTLVMMLYALTAAALPASVQVVSADTPANADTPATADPGLVLVYEIGLGEDLELSADSIVAQEGLGDLGPQNSVLVVFPRGAPFSAAAEALRAIDALTTATVTVVETDT